LSRALTFLRELRPSPDIPWYACPERLSTVPSVASRLSRALRAAFCSVSDSCNDRSAQDYDSKGIQKMSPHIEIRTDHADATFLSKYSYLRRSNTKEKINVSWGEAAKQRSNIRDLEMSVGYTLPRHFSAV
jgi:hypothetical protein